MDCFDHERMDVYQLAIEFVVVADAVSADLPRGRAYLADQLRRACTSIVLNIAEGAGEFSTDEKARFYRMARRSATDRIPARGIQGRPRHRLVLLRRRRQLVAPFQQL